MLAAGCPLALKGAVKGPMVEARAKASDGSRFAQAPTSGGGTGTEGVSHTSLPSNQSSTRRSRSACRARTRSGVTSRPSPASQRVTGCTSDQSATGKRRTIEGQRPRKSSTEPATIVPSSTRWPIDSSSPATRSTAARASGSTSVSGVCTVKRTRRQGGVRRARSAKD